MCMACDTKEVVKSISLIVEGLLQDADKLRETSEEVKKHEATIRKVLPDMKSEELCIVLRGYVIMAVAMRYIARNNLLLPPHTTFEDLHTFYSSKRRGGVLAEILSDLGLNFELIDMKTGKIVDSSQQAQQVTEDEDDDAE